MCGIAGFVDFAGRPAAGRRSMLEAMFAAVRHRGPDDWGRMIIDAGEIRDESADGARVWPRGRASGPTVGFVHARLAILDLSGAGHQPMAGAGRRTWLTYNGEIYNYRALRDRVRARGVPLRGTSDTEVLVALLAADGLDALGALRGMFALGWWDDRTDQLVLARDRFGMKPLVYARAEPDLLLFASQPRALMASGLIDATAHPDRAAEFLTRGSIDAARSFWQGMEAVPPATAVAVSADAIETRQWWSLEDTLLDSGPEAPVESVAAAARDGIADAVDAHMVSDVPVAIFLSGGVDSTAVLAAARLASDGPIRTFTVSIPGTPLDEAARAASVAARFRAKHLSVSIDDIDLDASLAEFFGAMQAPSVDGFNTFLVARAARQAGITVALTGIGGDELFGGYDSFVGVPRVGSLAALPAPAAAPLSALLARWPSPRAVKLAAILRARPRTIADVWWEYRRLLPDAEARALTGGEPPRAPDVERHRPAFSIVRYLETRCFLEGQLLADADAFTMCRAIELRTPFVDHRLVGTVAGAGRWRRRPGESFKQTLFRHLPELTVPDVIDRPKQGFVLPFDAWIREALTDPAPGRLRDFRERLSAPAYAPLVREFLAGRMHWSRLWAAYVLERLTAAGRTGS